MSELQTLVQTIEALQRQVEQLAGSPEQRRQAQAATQAERREAVWKNLGAPNGYIHPTGRARVVWNGRRWEAYVDGRRLRKTYRKSFNARVAAGIKLAAKTKNS